MTEYLGLRDTDGKARVLVLNEGRGQQPLPHFVRHSPSGFEWGYSGSGPADLARSILAHHLGGGIAPVARVYQLFKHSVIARLPRAEWRLTSDDITLWLDDALQTLELQCPRCGDQGTLWPEQHKEPPPENDPVLCSCEAGTAISDISSGRSGDGR